MSSSPLVEPMQSRKSKSQLFSLTLIWKVNQAGLLLVVKPHLVKTTHYTGVGQSNLALHVPTL